MAAPTARQVTGVANTLLQSAGVRRSVHGIEQCGSVLFAQLYEALTGSRPPTGGESETERCQAVVDAFSEQLSPHISLGHIRGRDLAARDPLTILNLLDIFSVLFHLPTVKERPHPVHASTASEGSDLISPEGYSVVSEVLREELGPAYHHTHLSSSCSTDSTAELLHPVPPSRLPLLHPHSTHRHSSHTPPSLTITSLTCSTITEDPSTTQPAALRKGLHKKTNTATGEALSHGGPPRTKEHPEPADTYVLSTSPPSTPPPPQRQLLSSPLHHSTPRTMAARSRMVPDHNSHAHIPPSQRVSTVPLTKAMTAAVPVSHPLTTALPHPLTSPPSSPPHTLTPPPSSPPHPLPTATESSASQTLEEGDEVSRAHTSAPAASVATRTRGSVEATNTPPKSTSEQEDTSGGGAPDPSPVAPPTDIWPRGDISLPPARGSPHMRGVSGERAEEVRREVLTSLYRRYLKELQATRKPAKKTEPSSAVKARDRSQRRGEQRQPRPGTKHGHKLEDKRECEREAGRERQPPTVGVTSDLFPVVEASLPVCPVATETVRRLWRKQLQQITTFTKRTPSHPHSVDNEISEMERKHTALLEAVKKEIDHTRRLHNQQEARVQQRAVKTELQARRQATARARRYFRDYELNLKSKLQKKRTNEEQVFRQVFEDGLGILKERERELRRFAREKRNTQRERQRQQLEAMEHYYRDQFSMLAESLTRQRVKTAVRDKAQSQLEEQLRRELREKLEREVRQLQDCLDRDDDVTHFRELDTQQLRLALHLLLTPAH